MISEEYKLRTIMCQGKYLTLEENPVEKPSVGKPG